MKNIRIWFKKTGTARYISHLDLSRVMSRAIHMAKLPFWYSEGFNPRVYLTITMPISLGYSGLRESMDVRLLDDDMPFSEIIDKLNRGLPEDIKIYEISEQVLKPSAVEFSSFSIDIETDNSKVLKSKFVELLASEEVNVEKHTKKGTRTVDIKPFFLSMNMDDRNDKLLHCELTLPSANTGSINPRLIFDAYKEKFGDELFPEITRTNCFDGDLKEFR